MKPTFQYKRCSFLDNTELLVSENETEYFPFHIHDYFCVSLITKGVEVLQTQESSFIAPAGTISITQANETHKNKSIDDSGYNYKTCYINPDLLQFYNRGKRIEQLERVIVDPFLFSSLHSLFTEEKDNLNTFHTALTKLAGFSQPKEDNNKSSFDAIDELIMSSEHNLCLDEVAKHFYMSKFHFSKGFKKAKGTSPQAYIMIQRLKRARKTLLDNEDKNRLLLQMVSMIAHI